MSNINRDEFLKPYLADADEYTNKLLRDLNGFEDRVLSKYNK